MNKALKSASDAQTFRSAGLVAAAGLGQATADQITDRQQGDQEPALIGAEPLTVGTDIDHPGGDQDTEDRKQIDNQFGGLKGWLGFPGMTALVIPVCDSPGGAAGASPRPGSAAGASCVVRAAGGHACSFWRRGEMGLTGIQGPTHLYPGLLWLCPCFL